MGLIVCWININQIHVPSSCYPFSLPYFHTIQDFILHITHSPTVYILIYNVLKLYPYPSCHAIAYQRSAYYVSFLVGILYLSGHTHFPLLYTVGYMPAGPTHVLHCCCTTSDNSTVPSFYVSFHPIIRMPVDPSYISYTDIYLTFHEYDTEYTPRPSLSTSLGILQSYDQLTVVLCSVSYGSDWNSNELFNVALVRKSNLALCGVR